MDSRVWMDGREVPLNSALPADDEWHTLVFHWRFSADDANNPHGEFVLPEGPNPLFWPPR